MPTYVFEMEDGTIKRIKADSPQDAERKIVKAMQLRQEADVLQKKSTELSESPYLPWEDMTGTEKLSTFAAPFGSEVARRGGSPAAFLGATAGDVATTFVPGVVAGRVGAKLAARGAPKVARGAATLAADALASGVGETVGQYASTGDVNPYGVAAGAVLPGVASGSLSGVKRVGQALGAKTPGFLKAPEVLKYAMVPDKLLREKVPAHEYQKILDEGLVPTMGGSKKLASNINAVLNAPKKAQREALNAATEQGVQIDPSEVMGEAWDYIDNVSMDDISRENAKTWIAKELDAYLKRIGKTTLNPTEAFSHRSDLEGRFKGNYVVEPAIERAKEALNVALNRDLKRNVPGFKEPTEYMRPYMGVLDVATENAKKATSPIRLRDYASMIVGGGLAYKDLNLALAAALGLGSLNRLTTTVGGANILNRASNIPLKLSDANPLIRQYAARPAALRGEQ